MAPAQGRRTNRAVQRNCMFMQNILLGSPFRYSLFRASEVSNVYYTVRHSAEASVEHWKGGWYYRSVKKTLLLRKPWSCNRAAKTALQPRFLCFETWFVVVSSSPEECFCRQTPVVPESVAVSLHAGFRMSMSLGHELLRERDICIHYFGLGSADQMATCVIQ